jgi:hypothetical protein
VWAGRLLVAVEPIFLVRVSGAAVVPTSLTSEEQVSLLGHRWWAPLDLKTTSEEIEPPELIEHFHEWLGASQAGR